MIMRARQSGAALVFELEGHLDFETTQQFQETCSALIQKSDARQVIFNFEKLKFVGSSGINQFIRVLKEFNGSDHRPRLCHLSSEFERVFRAYQTSRNPFEIFENEGEALKSFDAPVASMKKSRKKNPTTH